jgi:hypothetical protein
MPAMSSFGLLPAAISQQEFYVMKLWNLLFLLLWKFMSSFGPMTAASFQLSMISVLLIRVARSEKNIEFMNYRLSIYALER